MTVLSCQSIRAACIFSPFCERTVHEPTGSTYGCGAASYDVRIAQDVILLEYTTVLASTMEHFRMPHDICGIVHDKSSLARHGLQVQNTFIDPGWWGYLTLELSYVQLQDSPDGLFKIKAGTPIAQIVLHKLDQPTERPYEGVYQNQDAGVTPSQIKLDI